jgi:hypothetical protein
VYCKVVAHTPFPFPYPFPFTPFLHPISAPIVTLRVFTPSEHPADREALLLPWGTANGPAHPLVDSEIPFTTWGGREDRGGVSPSHVDNCFCDSPLWPPLHSHNFFAVFSRCGIRVVYLGCSHNFPWCLPCILIAPLGCRWILCDFSCV